MNTVNHLPKSPAAYVRISKDAEGKRLGVVRQRQDLAALCTSLGWGEPEFYEDNDTSASKKGGKRPDYDRMLTDIEAGERDGLLVYTVDRLTRRSLQLEEFIDWLETGRGQIRVPVQTMEADDFRSANGRMVLRIKGALAQQEAERISERTRRSLLQRVEGGQRASGSRFRPFGFSGLVDLQPIKSEQDEIRSWYRAILRGESIRSIVRDLQAREVPTVSGAQWTQRVVRDTLLSYRNVGKQEFSYADPDTKSVITELFKANWEPVVSDAEFIAVRDKLMANPGTGHGAARAHLLSGIMICGECGAKLVVTKGGKGQLEARCFKIRGGRGRLARRYVPIERYVLDWHLKAAKRGREALEKRPELKEEMRAKWLEVRASANPAEAKSDDIRARIDEVSSGYRKGEIAAEDFYPLLRDLRADLNKTEREAAAFAERQASIPDPDAIFADPIEIWEESAFDERRLMLSKAIETIAVHRSTLRGRTFDSSTVKIIRRSVPEADPLGGVSNLTCDKLVR